MSYKNCALTDKPIKGTQVMSISLLLFVLSIVSSDGGQQATLCQVYPSNYTFTTGHIENLMTIDLSNCTSNPASTTCQHPSTLTDSNAGGNTSNTQDYLVWNSTNRFSRLLFTFPTKIVLRTITLYYFVGRGSATANPRLEFLAVPDDFTLGGTTPDSTSLLSATLSEAGSSANVSLCPTMMSKLLVTKNNEDYRFGLSEVEFFTDYDNTSGSSADISPGMACPSVTTSTDLNIANTNTSRSTTISSTAPPPSSTSIEEASSLSEVEFFTDYNNTSNTTINGSSSTTISSNAPPPPSTTTKDAPSPVVFIAAPIVVVILALVVLMVVMVTVILACKRKQTSDSVKHIDLRENVSYSQTPNLQLSPHTGQVENPPTQSHSDIEIANGVECTSADGVQATSADMNEQSEKPSQQTTPTESHDTGHDMYAVVDKTKKKKMGSHLDMEGDPPPVPEHTVEMLYAAVQTKPKKMRDETIVPTNEDTDAPPVPGYTMEEL